MSAGERLGRGAVPGTNGVAGGRRRGVAPVDIPNYMASMPLPPFITPAAPRPRLEPPSGPQWSHEVKFDGWRVQVRRDGRGVALLSRRGLDIPARFSRVACAVEALS